METIETKARVTLTIPEACQLLGIGRNQGYEAARRGQIPTIVVGRRILVPRMALERILAGETTERPGLKRTV